MNKNTNWIKRVPERRKPDKIHQGKIKGHAGRCQICGRPSVAGTCKGCKKFLRIQLPMLKYQGT